MYRALMFDCRCLTDDSLAFKWYSFSANSVNSALNSGPPPKVISSGIGYLVSHVCLTLLGGLHSASGSLVVGYRDSTCHDVANAVDVANINAKIFKQYPPPQDTIRLQVIMDEIVVVRVDYIFLV